MKNQQQARLMTVLCLLCDRERIFDPVTSEATAFGVCAHRSKRTVVAGCLKTVEMLVAELWIKLVNGNGDVFTVSPEIEVCRKLASEKGMAVNAFHEACNQGNGVTR